MEQPSTGVASPALLDTVNRAGAFVVWIGLPITRDPAQTQRFDTINAIVQSEARKRTGRVAFVDTYATFASDSGGFAQYLTDASGKQVLVRAPTACTSSARAET